MDIERFRAQAHEVIDWICDYWTDLEGQPVRSQVAPGDILAQLSELPPEQGEGFARVLADFQDIVPPGLTHWQHPRFFAYFPANSSPPSVLAEMLTAAMGAQCMLWETSPAATEMETRVLQWLRGMLDLPSEWHGVIQDSASSATLCAILVARERATDWRVDEAGLQAMPPMRIYASKEAHSSIEKAVRIAGLGRQGLGLVPVDDAFRMRPDALAEMIAADRAAGILPIGVIASMGTTGVGAVDPIDAIGAICNRENLYLHVDAAWAGTALICPDQRWMAEGLEQADSFVFNPHKWMLTNFDCSAHYVRDPDQLIRTLTVLPAYLRTRVQGEVIDYRDWSVPLGRRFRALKLWFVIRTYGVAGLREIISKHIVLARAFAVWVGGNPRFELLAPPVLSLVVFRMLLDETDDVAALDAINDRLCLAINDRGLIYVTRTVVDGRVGIRLAVGQTNTEQRHVAEAWEEIQAVARDLVREGAGKP